MLRRDDRIAVAVSGGKDSVALLHILHKLEQDYPAASLVAVFIDEGIRGYREEASTIVRKHCEALNVECVVFSFKDLFNTTLDNLVADTSSFSDVMTPCSYCGVLRRKALNYAAKHVGATKLATAHNLDDEVQTALMNVVHGDIHRIPRTGAVTPGSIHGFVPRIKPLREIPENEIILYAYFKGVEFQTVTCPHGRYALRNKIRDFANSLEIGSPGSKYTILRSFDKLKTQLQPATSAEWRACTFCGEPSAGELCEACGVLLKLDRSLVHFNMSGQQLPQT